MDSQPARSGSILRFLSTHDLFEGVSQGSLAMIADASHWKKVDKGVFLFFQLDPAQSVYLLCTGTIAIRLENPDGRELIINQISPGECFGELGVLTGQPRSTSAEAIEDSQVLCIPRPAFETALYREPQLALRLLEITARRLQHSSRREEALAFHDAQQRLATQLLQLDALTQDKGYLTLSQEELAKRAGLTRQTVATLLGEWRRKDWLLTGRGHIVLLNRRELEKMTISADEYRK